MTSCYSITVSCVTETIVGSPFSVALAAAKLSYHSLLPLKLLFLPHMHTLELKLSGFVEQDNPQGILML